MQTCVLLMGSGLVCNRSTVVLEGPQVISRYARKRQMKSARRPLPTDSELGLSSQDILFMSRGQHVNVRPG